jgi:hypothetical protein
LSVTEISRELDELGEHAAARRWYDAVRRVSA